MDKTRINLYGITNCDTVKRARDWLSAQGLDYQFHDFKKQGVPEQHLDIWLQSVGWQTLVNSRGTTWRKLDEDQRTAVVDAATARTLVLAQPSVIKRPVVEWPDASVTVGFDETVWSAHLA